MTAIRFIAAATVRIAEIAAALRYRRGDPRASALVGILDLLQDLAIPLRRNELRWRRWWLQRLEQVAYAVEHDLPAAFGVLDQHTTEHLKHRASSAAAALRELKYQMAAAPPGTWKRVEAVLRQDALALATGALGRMRSAEPPHRPTRRRSRRRIAVDVVRIVVFAGLPLGAVFVAQPWLELHETVLNWAKVVGLSWALLYVLLTVDPTMRDKLSTVLALISRGQGGDIPPAEEGRSRGTSGPTDTTEGDRRPPR
jgi:hypothetical protein